MGAPAGITAGTQTSRIHEIVSLAGMVNTAEFYNREFGSHVPERDCMWEDRAFPLSRIYKEDLLSIGNTLKYLHQLAIPLLFVHGLLDDVVLPQDSQSDFLVRQLQKSFLRLRMLDIHSDQNSIHRS